MGRSYACDDHQWEHVRRSRDDLTCEHRLHSACAACRCGLVLPKPLRDLCLHIDAVESLRYLVLRLS